MISDGVGATKPVLLLSFKQASTAGDRLVSCWLGVSQNPIRILAGGRAQGGDSGESKPNPSGESEPKSHVLNGVGEADRDPCRGKKSISQTVEKMVHALCRPAKDY